jgi:hypothetical protein
VVVVGVGVAVGVGVGVGVVVVVVVVVAVAVEVVVVVGVAVVMSGEELDQEIEAAVLLLKKAGIIPEYYNRDEYELVVIEG